MTKSWTEMDPPFILTKDDLDQTVAEPNEALDYYDSVTYSFPPGVKQKQVRRFLKARESEAYLGYYYFWINGDREHPCPACGATVKPVEGKTHNEQEHDEGCAYLAWIDWSEEEG